MDSGADSVHRHKKEITDVAPNPCIIYKRIAAESRRADNGRYIVWYPYDVQVISKDPEFELFDTFLNHFDYGREGAPFVKDNLHHSNFTIYT